MMTLEFDRFLQKLHDAYLGRPVSDSEVDKYMTYYIFAKQFGWTPEQVDKMAYKDVRVFKKLLEIEAKEREYMMSKMERREWGV